MAGDGLMLSKNLALRRAFLEPSYLWRCAFIITPIKMDAAMIEYLP